jgi:hypothetical protein
MAITKFKISRLPQRAELRLLGGLIPLNQEYFISQQSDMTVDALDRGVPYDSFGFKLGNDNGDWSLEYSIIINALVNVFDPEVTTIILEGIIDESSDVTANFVFNDSTDRVTIDSITQSENFYINGILAQVGKTYMLYDFINLSIIPTNVNGTEIYVTPKNNTTNGTSTLFEVTIKGNLIGAIVSEGITSAEIE